MEEVVNFVMDRAGDALSQFKADRVCFILSGVFHTVFAVL